MDIPASNSSGSAEAHAKSDDAKLTAIERRAEMLAGSHGNLNNEVIRRFAQDDVRDFRSIQSPVLLRFAAVTIAENAESRAGYKEHLDHATATYPGTAESIKAFNAINTARVDRKEERNAPGIQAMFAEAEKQASRLMTENRTQQNTTTTPAPLSGLDPAVLERTAITRKRNAIQAHQYNPEPNNVAAAARAEAFKKDPPEVGVKKHPELAGSYAAAVVIDKKAQADGLTMEQQAVVASRVRANVAASIEKGQIPAVDLKEHTEVSQTVNVKRDLER